MRLFNVFSCCLLAGSLFFISCEKETFQTNQPTEEVVINDGDLGKTIKGTSIVKDVKEGDLVVSAAKCGGITPVVTSTGSTASFSFSKPLYYSCIDPGYFHYAIFNVTTGNYLGPVQDLTEATTTVSGLECGNYLFLIFWKNSGAFNSSTPFNIGWNITPSPC